jgi:hypothetical protein
MTYPAILFLALLLWSFTWPKENLIYLLFGTAAFGTLAVIPPALVAGMNLMPMSLTALVMLGRYGLDRQFIAALPANAFSPYRLGLLTAFMAVAVVSAVFFPAMFKGQATVIAMNTMAVLLQPTGAQISQTGYLIVSYGIALAVCASANDPKMVQKLLKSFVLGGAILAFSGVADFALGGAREAVLGPFKTAWYDYHDDAEMLGARRLVGFMAEAAAFGGTCVVYAALNLFASTLLADRRLRIAATLIGALLLVLAIMSTSSTAYVGVAIVGVLYCANLGRRGLSALTPGSSQSLRFLLLAELAACYLAVAGVALAAVLAPHMFEKPIQFLDAIIFKKTSSGSFEERMMWNQVALEALAKTNWLGVGVGGARTSNWFVSILSNTGVLGAIFMFSFVAMVLLKPAPRDPFAGELVRLGRAALLVSLIMAGLSATTTDFGVLSGGLFGVVVAYLANPARARRPLGRERELARPQLAVDRSALPTPSRPTARPATAAAAAPAPRERRMLRPGDVRRPVFPPRTRGT